MNHYFLFVLLLTPEAIPVVSSLLVAAGFGVMPGFGNGTIQATHTTPWPGAPSVWALTTPKDMQAAGVAVNHALNGKVSYLSTVLFMGDGRVNGAYLLPLAPVKDTPTAYDHMG